MTSDVPIKVGILLLTEDTQLLDVAPIDLLGMLEPHWLRFIGLPEEAIAHAPRFEFHFVNETGEGPYPMSAGFKLAVTVNPLSNSSPPLSSTKCPNPPPYPLPPILPHPNPYSHSPFPPHRTP